MKNIKEYSEFTSNEYLNEVNLNKMVTNGDIDGLTKEIEKYCKKLSNAKDNTDVYKYSNSIIEVSKALKDAAMKSK